MAIPRWNPSITPTKAEERILARLKTHRKLFVFLRQHRHEIFDDDMQDLLAAMYRDTGAGAPPQPPAMLCMALLLQAYTGVSDREAVELSVDDARWQMVLGCMGEAEPAFSQGDLQQFRDRLIANDLDERVLERTVEIARRAKFSKKSLPKSLRIAMDSRPLVGAGKVEDTFNLLGHAARKIAECAANLTGLSFDEVCQQAHAPVLLASSTKAGLDVDWSDAEQKREALEDLFVQVNALAEWVGRAMSGVGVIGPITKYLEALQQVVDQNLDVENGRVVMHQGVAPDRRVSIEDEDMRHGRKSQSRCFNGYKEHIAVEIDSGVIVACAVTPANVPEADAAPMLKEEIEAQGHEIRELVIDLGYANSVVVAEIEANRGEVICKPWPAQHSLGLFSKKEFHLDLRTRRITCPAGQTATFRFGDIVEFEAKRCRSCKLRSQCTHAAIDSGRTVRIGTAVEERRQRRFQKLLRTPSGRRRLRARTVVEHRLAHVSSREGPRARFRGARKNEFQARSMGIIANLHIAQRAMSAS